MGSTGALIFFHAQGEIGVPAIFVLDYWQVILINIVQKFAVEMGVSPCCTVSAQDCSTVVNLSLSAPHGSTM